MPVHTISARNREHNDLVLELVAVLRRNEANGPPDEPAIYFEEVRHSNRLRVTVLWEKWEKIDPEARGEMILDAIGQARGEAEMLRVSSALGLTEREAHRLRIREALQPKD